MTHEEFSEQYTANYHTTCRLLNRRGVPTDKIEDVAQAGWLHVWEKLHKFDNRCKFFSWAFTVIWREYLSSTRSPTKSCTRESSGITIVDTKLEPSINPTVLQDLIAKESLPKDPVIRVYITLLMDGYKLEDISEFTGVNVNTCKVRLFRYRRRFREPENRT